jgi:hypothetical protein
MRKLVVVLGVTSVTFAATTLYLARELVAERARTAASSSTSSARHPVPDSVPAAGRPDSSAEDAVPTGEAPLAAALPAEQRARRDFAQRFLAQIHEPRNREELLAENKVMMRNAYPRLDQVLGLSSEEYQRLLELFALQHLESQERHARCAQQPDCADLAPNYPDPREREIADLLADRQARFEAYRNSLGEREAVTQLRARLPEGQTLSEANAEHLIAALADERNRLHQEAAARGSGLTDSSVGAGLVFSAAEGGSLEQRYETARQNSQRLRDRAAPYLTPAQRRAFDEMQDEALLSLRSQLRNKELFTAGNGSG